MTKPFFAKKQNGTGYQEPKRIMISQPMNGLTIEEVTENKAIALKALENKEYEVLNTYFQSEWVKVRALNNNNNSVHNIPLCFLARSIDMMSCCDAVYFCKGWENARGCKIEHDIAIAYGLDTFYEE